jgi:hypothetical protein
VRIPVKDEHSSGASHSFQVATMIEFKPARSTAICVPVDFSPAGAYPIQCSSTRGAADEIRALTTARIRAKANLRRKCFT